MSRPERGLSPDPAARGPHVLVLGGGASGVLMAAHLLAQGPCRVTLVEGRNRPGQGIAYSTLEPDHLLNTRVHNMSAWPDDPHHFQRWLADRPEGAGVTAQCFVSRATYGAYLNGLVQPWLNPERTEDSPGGLHFIADSCVGLTEDPQGVRAELSSGQVIGGDLAVLATGHVLPGPDPAGILSEAWAPPEGLDPKAAVVILGTGLSMVDQVLSLLNRGHTGPITAISRRGQRPRAHSDTKPVQIDHSDLPPPAPLSGLLRWLRGQVRAAEAAGGSWRDVVDGLRVHVQGLWRQMDQATRARYLRHAATWWDVHRHRIPTASGKRIDAALAAGQLRIERGAFVSAARLGEGALALQLRARNGTIQTLNAARIVDCRGIRRDPSRNAAPPIAGLLASGAARLDPLSIGLDIDGDCQLVDATGQASARIFAIGPVSRAAFWEITAIPDIRVQVAGLARRFVGQQSTTSNT